MRILLVDDHPLFREGLASLLAARGIEVVGEARDGQEGLEKTRSLQPDAVLMDITMPRMGGLEATRLIKAEMPQVNVIILTVSDEEQHLFEAIKSGAQGYLLKSLEPEEFFRLLEGLAKGEAPITRGLATKILQEFSRQTGKMAQEETQRGGLTPREKEVLALVAEGATNRDTAASLHISENTVKYHLKNILDKLHLDNRAQVIAYAARRGLGGNLPKE